LGISFSSKEKETIRKIRFEDFPEAKIPKAIQEKVTEAFDFVSMNKAVKDLETEWRKKEKVFWQKIGVVFPVLKEKAVSLEIRPTSFGSCASFNLANLSGRSVNLTVYIRLDMDVSSIAEAVLSALFKKSMFSENYGWEETEAVVDFLLVHVFGHLFPKYKPTIAAIRNKEMAGLWKESFAYQQKLGVGAERIFEEKDNRIFVYKKPVDTLSPTEKEVLGKLLEKRNCLVSFDEIGEVIWKEKAEENFSPWAIAKTIWRIRKKLEGLGVDGSVIKTWRKKGYLLRDYD
ncbi:MAG: helix-turn-helix domain-containing protein, partial [bacterium]|nr:helix-turn-helix domain-containing protein [bacterium]